jgi:hypothetical protein
MCSLWWVEEPPVTCRASVKIYKFKKRRILLAVIWNYITMHGHTNIKFISSVVMFGVMLIMYLKALNIFWMIQQTCRAALLPCPLWLCHIDICCYYCIQMCVCCHGVSGVVGVSIYCRSCLCICQYYDCDIIKKKILYEINSCPQQKNYKPTPNTKIYN